MALGVKGHRLDSRFRHSKKGIEGCWKASEVGVGVPKLSETVVTFGVLTQGGGCSHKMAAEGGRAIPTPRGSPGAGEKRGHLKYTVKEEREKVKPTLWATAAESSF